MRNTSGLSLPKSTKFRNVVITVSMPIFLAACGGSDSSFPPPSPPPPPPPPPPVTISKAFQTDASTARFLNRATFGATTGSINGASGTEVSDWIVREFGKPITRYMPGLLAEEQALTDGQRLRARRITDVFMDGAITADDQLRQRTVFALSEIVVTSLNSTLSNYPVTYAHYVDTLSENAFGNYRDLLDDVTYTPAMAFYLTYLRNRKGDANTGRMPDENYARELLQLFTIGLVELNLDGTEKTDGNGDAIEIFDNSDITGLAKVFTGLSFQGERFFNLRENEEGFYSPLKVFPEYHSELEKSFLTLTIPPNTPGEESIDMALDEIFSHPNMAPFVSRQLIQKFVTSNPEPAYVQRVATAFDSGSFTLPDGNAVGTGQRGDMKATIAAVLLDDNALQDPQTAPASFGKIREPAIRVINWARAFNETTPNVGEERSLDGFVAMGQLPFYSPSVFNFFRPGYVAPSSATGDAGLTIPELQIVNETSSVAYLNTMNSFIYNFSETRPDEETAGLFTDYAAEFALADDPQALVAHLDLLLTGNSLSQASKDRMIAIMNEIPVSTAAPDEDKLTRVLLSVTMAMSSPGYLVQR